MIALYLWAALSIGALPGIAIGYIFGWTRGHVAGVEAGRGSDRRWAAYLESAAPGYPQLLPHGKPAHRCSAKCRPPDPR